MKGEDHRRILRILAGLESDSWGNKVNLQKKFKRLLKIELNKIQLFEKELKEDGLDKPE